MEDFDWKTYRHPEFLQSLNITVNERKYLNLFLKRNKFEKFENTGMLRKTRFVIASKGLNSSKNFDQQQVGIDT